MNLWVEDPKTKERSVSLTLLLVAASSCLVAGALEMFEVVKSTSIFSEMLYSFVALYFGRKVNIKGNNFSSEKAQEIENKINEVKKENE